MIVTSKELDFAEQRSVRINNHRPILVQNIINFNIVSTVSSGISNLVFRNEILKALLASIKISKKNSDTPAGSKLGPPLFSFAQLSEKG